MRYTPFVLGGAILLAITGVGLTQEQPGGNPSGQSPMQPASPATQQGSPAMQPAGGQTHAGTTNGQAPASSGMNHATRHTMHRLRHHHHHTRPVRQPS